MADDRCTAVPRTADDWNGLWQKKQSLRGTEHGADYWNARARTYATKDSPNSYTARFLELAELKPGDAVFDMGCGTGNLTIPLAKAGHPVLAADFSRGMLDKLEAAVAEEGLGGRVRTLQLSWDDDWHAAGLEEGQFDICFASRSIATTDLLGALRKLNGVANRRACITLPTGTSPRIDDRMLREIGFDVQPSYDGAYALALLSALGQLPTVCHLPTTRVDSFTDEETAFQRYHQMAVEYERGAQERIPEAELTARVRAWLDENLVPAPSGTDGLTLAQPRESFWTFIAWDKRSNA